MSSLPAFLVDLPRNPVFAVGLPVTLGLLSGSQTGKVVRSPWWENLYQPVGKPPDWLFAPVWTTLYAAMGYASHLGVKALDQALTPSKTESARVGIGMYYVQLGLNLLWTPLFFGMKKPSYALVDLTLLTGSTFYTTYQLHEATDGASTWFLAPYCAWLSYASYLNASIVYFNQGRRGADGKKLV